MAYSFYLILFALLGYTPLPLFPSSPPLLFSFISFTFLNSILVFLYTRVYEKTEDNSIENRKFSLKYQANMDN